MRPVFSRIQSFPQIIEPIHDAFSGEFQISSDAIKVKVADTIATASVTLTLHQDCKFEVKLDGYKAHFLDIRIPEDLQSVKRHINLFERAICDFMSDGVPADWRFVIPCWLKIDGGMNSAVGLIRKLTWSPESQDPFEIGADATRSQIKFECSNKEELWTTNITIDQSALGNADLFLEFSCGYTLGSRYDTFDERTGHIYRLSEIVMDKLGLILE